MQRENDIISYRIRGELASAVNRIRSDVDSFAGVDQIGDTVYLIFCGAVQNNLQLQLVMPVCRKVAVGKTVKVIYKF